MTICSPDLNDLLVDVKLLPYLQVCIRLKGASSQLELHAMRSVCAPCTTLAPNTPLQFNDSDVILPSCSLCITPTLVTPVRSDTSVSVQRFMTTLRNAELLHFHAQGVSTTYYLYLTKNILQMIPICVTTLNADMIELQTGCMLTQFTSQGKLLFRFIL